MIAFGDCHSCKRAAQQALGQADCIALADCVLIVSDMQKILSTFDVAPCYHEEYHNVMERFVAAFDVNKPVLLFGSTVGGTRGVVGRVVRVEKRGVDLYGEVVVDVDESQLAGKYVHMSWYIGGTQGIGLSEGHFSPHPHATSYDFADDDGDGNEF